MKLSENVPSVLIHSSFLQKLEGHLCLTRGFSWLQTCYRGGLLFFLSYFGKCLSTWCVKQSCFGSGSKSGEDERKNLVKWQQEFLKISSNGPGFVLVLGKTGVWIENDYYSLQKLKNGEHARHFSSQEIGSILISLHFFLIPMHFGRNKW